MARQYCFRRTFQRIIGFLDTLRELRPSVSLKMEPDACTIAFGLTYRTDRTYDYLVAAMYPGGNP